MVGYILKLVWDHLRLGRNCLDRYRTLQVTLDHVRADLKPVWIFLGPYLLPEILLKTKNDVILTQDVLVF